VWRSRIIPSVSPLLKKGRRSSPVSQMAPRKEWDWMNGGLEENGGGA
jgi:hypothetical protein